MANSTYGSAYSGKYAAELIETAARIIAPGKGILAADESTGTIGKRVRMLLTTTFLMPIYIAHLLSFAFLVVEGDLLPLLVLH